MAPNGLFAPEDLLGSLVEARAHAGSPPPIPAARISARWIGRGPRPVRARNSLEMEQATHVGARHELGIGEVVHAGAAHSSRELGELDGEAAAEAAAFVGPLRRDQLQAGNLGEQGLYDVAPRLRVGAGLAVRAQAEIAQPMAAPQHGDPVWEAGAELSTFRFIDQELGQLEGRRALAGTVPLDPDTDLGKAMTDGGNAAPRWADDRVMGGEPRQVPLREVGGSGCRAGVQQRLTATGLVGVVVDAVAEMLEDADRGPGDPGCELVDITRNEEADVEGRHDAEASGSRARARPGSIS